MSSGAALFGGNGRQSQGAKSLVEFKAGKLNLNGTKMSADPRKGLVFVEMGDDDLVHFKWKDRTKGDVEDDLIIFQDDVEYSRIKECTDGRVFVLKLKSSNAKHFFWMQEPSSEKDEEYWQKIVEVVKDPSSKSRNSGGNSLTPLTDLSGLEVSNLRDSELQSMLSHLSQQQLAHLFGPVRQRRSGATDSRPAAIQSTGSSASSVSSLRDPVADDATTASSAKSSTTSKPPIQLEHLQSILSELRAPPGVESTGLEDILTGSSIDVLQPLLENPDFVKKMKDLLSDTIVGDVSPQDQDEDNAIQSPEAKEALSIFSDGFQTGQLAPLIREFELGDEAIQAATTGDLGAFLKALQKNKNKAGEESKSKDNMDLD